jgi:hypothetical protein
VWLYVRLLLPLLPTVRADREANPDKNLRVRLSTVLPQLLLSPYVRADVNAAAVSDCMDAGSSSSSGGCDGSNAGADSDAGEWGLRRPRAT